ncbi:MAG: YgcG family protein [Vicinamibacterales bacterium]
MTGGVRPWLGAAVVVALVAAALAAPAAAAAQPAPPELTAPVNDFAGVLDGAAEAELDRVIRALEAASGDAIVVATVDTFQPWGSLQQYATAMFENHGKGIGAAGKDNGLLVVLAVADRQVRFEVGYDLEAFVTDGFAGETSRQVMVPFFQQGDYGGGLVAGVSRAAQRIAEGRNVSLDGVEVRTPPRQKTGIPAGAWIVLALLLFNLFGGGGRGRSRRWHSRVGPFGAGYYAGRWGGGGFGGGGFGGGGFGGFGGGRSGGGGGGASW